MDEVRQVSRYHHYAIRTERTCRDWILNGTTLSPGRQRRQGSINALSKVHSGRDEKIRLRSLHKNTSLSTGQSRLAQELKKFLSDRYYECKPFQACFRIIIGKKMPATAYQDEKQARTPRMSRLFCRSARKELPVIPVRQL